MQRRIEKETAVPASPLHFKGERPIRVLCAEDDAALGEMLKTALGRAGHFVELVSDGYKALTRVTDNPEWFDVLVTDHDMPNLSGLGLVSKLRDTPFSGTIIVHSSALTEAQRAAYHALAVDAVLSKPVQLSVLLAAIQPARPASEA